MRVPSFGEYLKKLGLEEKAVAGSALPVRAMTDEEIIAQAEAALTSWAANPRSMQRVTIH